MLQLFFKFNLLFNLILSSIFLSRDPKNIHALITKSSAKERYLLNDVDLDIREPKLNYLLKRNPHNSSWGDMRLYLEAQVTITVLETCYSIYHWFFIFLFLC